MPRIIQTQVGSVFLKEVSPRRWRASWTDALTKKHVRRVLPAASFKEAEEQARTINQELAAGRGFGGRMRGTVGHTVSDAVAEAIKHSNANPQTQRDYASFFNAFAKYLLKEVPGVQSWGEVTQPIVENFIQYSRKQDIAHDTLRYRLFILRLTGAYMARTYSYPNHTTGIKLRRIDPPQAELDGKDAILTPAQLRALLQWLRVNEPMIHVWAVLQGLCGLRQLEAVYMTENDFNPTAKTIRITANAAHKPKNRPSYRTIPVCDTVARTLGDWIDGLRVRHNQGFVFMPTKAINGRKGGRTDEARAGVITRDRASHLWAAAIKRAKAGKCEIPAAFHPRKLRASFVTALREVGADLAVLQAYIGHAPTTILSAHYDKMDLPRLKPIADLAQDLFDATRSFAEAKNESQIN